MKIIKVILITIFSSGWIIPLISSGHNLIQYFDAELINLIRGDGPQYDYPFILITQYHFLIAMVWLFFVVTFWSVVAAIKLIYSK